MAASKSTQTTRGKTGHSQMDSLCPTNDCKTEESKGWFLSAREGLMWCWIQLNFHLLTKPLVLLPSQIFGSHWMWWKCGLLAKTAVWSLWLAGFIFGLKGGGTSIKPPCFILNLNFANRGRRIHSSLGDPQNLCSLVRWIKIWVSASPPSSYVTFSKWLGFSETWVFHLEYGHSNKYLLILLLHPFNSHLLSPMYQAVS